MANYYGSARSNYFRVKDSEAFIEDMDNLSGVTISKLERDDTERFVLLGDDGDGNDWNVLEEDEETGEYEDVCLWDRVAKHLPDDEVAIFMDAGSEKLRYIHGAAVAINGKGESLIIRLTDIYELAQKLTEHPENITPAEY